MKQLVVGKKTPFMIDLSLLIPLGLFFVWGDLFLFLTAFFFSLLHEGAHLFAARTLGYTPACIRVNMFGEVLQLKQARIWPEHQILIFLAGPCLNLTAAFLCFLFQDMFDSETGFPGEGVLFQGLWRFFSSSFMGFSPCQEVLLVNLLLAFFNLLPFFPLDGGKVVGVYLSYYLGEKKGSEATVFLGKIFSICNFLLGLYLVQYNVLNGLVSALGLSLFASCRREEKRRLYLDVQRARGKGEYGEWYG